MAQTVGRIEGLLEAIREDMRNAADAQRALVCRLEDNEARLSSLETWKQLLGQHENNRLNRNRTIGAIGLALLVPAIGLVAEVNRWIHYLVDRTGPADSRPAPPPRRPTP